METPNSSHALWQYNADCLKLHTYLTYLINLFVFFFLSHSVAKNLQAFVGYADLGGEDLFIHFNGTGAVVDIQQETTGDMKGPLDLVFQTPTKGEAEGDTVATIHVPRLEDFLRKSSS